MVHRGRPVASGRGGGASAGVGLLAPAGRAALGSLPGLSFDISPASTPRRLATAFVDLGPGFLCSTVYQWTGEPLASAANMDSLHAAGLAIKKFWEACLRVWEKCEKIQNAIFERIKPIIPGFVRIRFRFERIPGRSIKFDQKWWWLEFFGFVL